VCVCGALRRNQMKCHVQNWQTINNGAMQVARVTNRRSHEIYAQAVTVQPSQLHKPAKRTQSRSTPGATDCDHYCHVSVMAAGHSCCFTPR
jgi:hypothetical protein